MRRKVLIAEQTDTLRSIAETILRQNGYDVISVTAAEKAREVLDLSQPDLVIVGADLVAPDGSLYYERVQQDAKTGNIPMLLFEPAGETDAVLPEEVVIPRPLDPKDFLDKVTAILGAKQSGAKPAPDSPDDVAVDDEFLDAALGLDALDVTDSEVMDKTVMGRRSKSGAAAEKLIGLDTAPPTDENETGSNTVESLIIDEDSSQIKHRTLGRSAPAANASGAIEIMTDQYGLAKPGSKAEDEDAAHDYDWFVDAMRTDGDPAGPPSQGESGPLSITDPAASVDPITPDPAAPAGGVEKFIDEFKKEMEQVRAEEEGQPVPERPVPTPVDAGEELAWEEKLEQIGPAQIDLFIREFARVLGEKVAKIMIARIDPDKLLSMIKSGILEQHNKST